MAIEPPPKNAALKMFLGCLVLFGGSVLCIAMSVFWHNNAAMPANMPVLKADKYGVFREPGTYQYGGYTGGQEYKLCRIDMPDGSWHVVAVPYQKR